MIRPNCLVGNTTGTNTMENMRELLAPARRTITQVKTFSARRLWSIECELNIWLEQQGPAFRLVDIKFIVMDDEAESYKVMAIYTDWEPLEDDEEADV